MYYQLKKYLTDFEFTFHGLVHFKMFLFFLFELLQYLRCIRQNKIIVSKMLHKL